jgi:hypothetical protein
VQARVQAQEEGEAMTSKNNDEIVFTEVTVPAGAEKYLNAINGGTPRRINGEYDLTQGRVFRPMRLYLIGDLDGLLVKQVIVGCEACVFGDDWTIPAGAFAEGAKDPKFPMPTIGPEIHIQITVRNSTKGPLRVAAKLVGPSVIGIGNEPPTGGA